MAETMIKIAPPPPPDPKEEPKEKKIDDEKKRKKKKEMVAGAVASAIKKRDQLLKDIMNEVDDEDRGRLMTISINTLPKDVLFIEWIIVVCCFSKIGILDLHDENDYIDIGCYIGRERGDCWSYSTDHDGRITRLVIGGHTEEYFEEGVFEDDEGEDDFSLYDLPSIVGRLEKLVHLELYNCKSLPAELSNVSHLSLLALRRCSDVIVPMDMKLNQLKKLYIGNCRFKSASTFFEWMTGQENLNSLGIDKMKGKETDCLFATLTNSNLCFEDNLVDLDLSDCEINENRLGTFSFQIMPKLTILTTVGFNYNDIHSFQPIVHRIKVDPDYAPSKSLTCLNLFSNPIDTSEIDPKEKSAILRFLQIFYTLHSSSDSDMHDSDIEYALTINRAGRSILEGNCKGDRSLPLSVWPIVLERAHAYSGYFRGRNATGLYYLLRNGPALIGRSDLISGNNNDIDAGVDTKKKLLKRNKCAETKDLSYCTDDTTISLPYINATSSEQPAPSPLKRETILVLLLLCCLVTEGFNCLICFS